MLRLRLHLPLTKLTSERGAYVHPSNINRADYSAAGVSHSGTDYRGASSLSLSRGLNYESNTELLVWG